MFALAGLSTALANKGVIEIRPDWKEPLLLWTMTVLEPANRKSAVLKLMLDSVWQYERCRVNEVRSGQQRAQRDLEMLQKALKKKENELTRAIAEGAPEEEQEQLHDRINDLRLKLAQHEVPQAERLVADDVTGEALGQLMADNHGRAAILSAEGEIFRIMAGRYGDKPVFNIFKKGWTGDEHIRDDRVTREGSQISRPALTLGLGLQPQLLRSLKRKDSFRGEGLLGRFLAIQPESPAGHRKTGEDVPELDQEAKARYERNLSRLLGSEPAQRDKGEWTSHIMPLSDEARERLYEFEAQVEEYLRFDLHTLKDWAGKLVGNTARVAGLLHVADQAEEDSLWKEPVSGQAMAAAIDLSNHLVPHAKTIFAEMGLDWEVRLDRYVLRRIRAVEDLDELTIRGVQRLCRGKKEIDSVEDVKEVLNRLEERNVLRTVSRPSSNGRPPSPWVRLHPQLRAEMDRTDRTPRTSTPEPNVDEG